MSKALELAKFGRESAPTGAVIGDTDTQTLSAKTFSDMPTFSSGTANGVPYLNASKVFTTGSNLVFDGTNLGVGTSSPTAKLHVAVAGDNETVIARFGTTSTGSVLSSLKVLSDPTNSVVKFDATGAVANSIYFLTGGTERMRVESGGNVGINTGTAGAKLDVGGSLRSQGLTATSSSIVGGASQTTLDYLATSGGARLLGWGANTTTRGQISLSVVSSDASLYTEAIRVDNTGKVGMGTASPAATLHVVTTSGAAAVFSAPSGTTQQNSVQFVNSTNNGYTAIAGAGTTSAVGNWINGSQILEFVPAGTGNSIISGYTGDLTFQTYGRNERMRILSNGNISFGPTGTADRPVHLIGAGTRQYIKSETTTNNIGNEAGFEIKTPNSNYLIGSHGSTNALWVYDINGVAERLRIDSTGRLLVGSTSGRGGSTTQHLFRIPTGSAYLEIQQESSTGATDVLFTHSSTGSYGIVGYDHSTDALRLYTNSSERLRITSAGYVGIGTTDPQSLLTINSGGTDNVAYATINQTTDFAATSRAGFSGLTNNSGGFYFGMGANGTGIPAGFGFFRESTGWNTALAFYTNNQTSGSYSTRAMQEKMRLDSSGNLTLITKTDNYVNSYALPGSLKFQGTGWNTMSGTLPTGASISLVGAYNELNGGSTEPSLAFSLYGTGSGGYNTTAGPTTPTERMRITNYGKVGIGQSNPKAGIHSMGGFWHNGSNGNVGNSGYNFVGTISAGSAFNNPTINLLTVSNGVNYSQVIVKVRVFQTGWSQQFAAIYSGYATLAYSINTWQTPAVTTMTMEGNFGCSVGTLSWNGNTLQLVPVRATNYDSYVIVLEYMCSPGYDIVTPSTLA